MEKFNISDETIKQEYDFSSTVVMGENEHKDFNNVTYSRTSTFSFIFLIISIVFTIPQQFLFPENKGTLLGYSACMLFLIGYLFFLTQKRVNDAYKRIVVSQGQETITYNIHFGEKIVAETDQHAPVEYDFSAITSVKETSQFYLLGLKYNLYLILQKDIKSNLENVDFIEYVFNKCPNIKNKKVKRITHKKKESIIYLCAFVVLFLFNLICFFI